MKKIILFLLLCLCFPDSGSAQQQKTSTAKKVNPAVKSRTTPKLGKDTWTRCLIETPKGNITVVLYDETPWHRDNFIHLVRYKMYDGTLFHRVIDSFMIQGGDPESKNAQPGQKLGKGSVGYTVPAEFRDGIYHKKGALAAARMGDDVNPEKVSSGSQFYLVQGKVFTRDQLAELETKYNRKFTSEQIEIYTTVGGTPHLDGNYTVFGEVVEGWAVIDAIAAVPRDEANRPLEDIPMRITVIAN